MHLVCLTCTLTDAWLTCACEASRVLLSCCDNRHGRFCVTVYPPPSIGLLIGKFNLRLGAILTESRCAAVRDGGVAGGVLLCKDRLLPETEVCRVLRSTL